MESNGFRAHTGSDGPGAGRGCTRGGSGAGGTDTPTPGVGTRMASSFSVHLPPTVA